MNEYILESNIIVILEQNDEEIVGFDFVSLGEANNVSGIWNLKPGAHFLYIKTKEQEENRLGEFIYFKNGEIKVFKRSKDENESLFKLDEGLSTENYKESIIMGHLKNKMSKIPDNLSQLWSNITDCINQELIIKLRPINKVIKNQQYEDFDSRGNEVYLESRNDRDLREATIRVELSDSEEDSSKTLEEYKQIASNMSHFSNKMKFKDFKDKCDTTPLPKNCKIDETVEQDYNSIYYSDLPMYDSRINKFKDISPQMLTSMCMDTSYVLDSIREGYENDKYGYKCKEFENKYFYVLGELQYSFVLFLLCFNYESLQQYNKLLKAFCNAETLLIKNQELTKKFLKTLRYHVEIWDDEHDVYQEDNFLTHYLSNLKEIMVDNQNQLSPCLDDYKQLEDSFKLKFGISLEDLDSIHTNVV